MLNLIGRYTKIIPIALLVASGSFAYVQTVRLGNHKNMIEDLEDEVSSLKDAAVIVERLRGQTEALASERDELLREIRNADGYDTPLPDDVRTILDRMQ